MSKDILYKSAVDAATRAYAPYSNFNVGAAILTSSGNIYTGCNVENAAYPQGLCAEASAIAKMIDAGDKEISQVCVHASEQSDVAPCGGCRQKLSEFSTPATLIHLSDNNGITTTWKLSDLLPSSFGGDDLV